MGISNLTHGFIRFIRRAFMSAQFAELAGLVAVV